MRKRTSRIYPDGITECNEVYAPFSDGWQYCDAIYKCDESGVMTCLWEKINEEWVDRALTIITDVYACEGYNYLIIGTGFLNEENMHLLGSESSSLFCGFFPAKNRIYIAAISSSNCFCGGYYELKNGYAVRHNPSDYSVPVNLAVTTYGLINCELSKTYANDYIMEFKQKTLYITDGSGAQIASVDTPNGVMAFLYYKESFVWLSMKDIGGTKYLTVHRTTDFVDIETSIVSEITLTAQSQFLCKCAEFVEIENKTYFIICYVYRGSCAAAWIVSYDGENAVIERDISSIGANGLYGLYPHHLKKVGDYWFIVSGNNKAYISESLQEEWIELLMEFPEGTTIWEEVAGMTATENTYHIYAYDNNRVFRYDFEYGMPEEMEVTEIEYFKVKQE